MKPKPRKLLSEREAWMVLAQHCATDPMNVGLCRHIGLLCNQGLVSFDVSSAMTKRMRSHAKGRTFDNYWWPRDHAGYAARAAFCKLMAKLCGTSGTKRKRVTKAK